MTDYIDVAIILNKCNNFVTITICKEEGNKMKKYGKKLFDSVRSVECACRGEAGELAFQFLRGSLVAFRMITADGVDDGGIDRMDTHKDDFEERHDFRLFGIHIFINRYFNFF